MTPKRALFVAEYRKDLNATRAYIAAGYSPKGAGQSAEKLLKNTEIAQAVAIKTQQQLANADISAERVLREIGRLAFSDMRLLFDADGRLKPIHTLNADEAACIASLEIIVKNAEAGDGHMDTVHKLKVWDKSKNLEMLAKHFALLTENVKHSGEIRMSWIGDE